MVILLFSVYRKMERTSLYMLSLTAFVLLSIESSSGVVRLRDICSRSYIRQRILSECSKEEFSCLNGNCIPRNYYCDNGNDCEDNSDEKYCKSPSSCSGNSDFMKCNSGRCIPVEWWCDNRADCPAGDDEQKCGNWRSSVVLPIDSARQRAMNWLNHPTSDGVSTPNWGAFSHKAAVALYLSKRDNDMSSSGLTSQKELADELSIQLLSQLIQKRINDVPSTDLSSFVNALLVTCRDPRQFYGMNLVQELRSRVDRENYTNPYILLTLCNAGETIKMSDELKLIQALQSNHRELWTDVKAIAVMALACASNQPLSNTDPELLKDLTTELISHQYMNGTFENLQTTALVMQALYSVEIDEDPDDFDMEKAFKQILASQQPDGSFGSFMKTYYVLPVLRCSSLVNISSSHCETANSNERSAMQDLMNKGGIKMRIQYSLWIGNEKDIEKILALKVPANTSFYGIMEIAANIDKGFRFEYVVKNRKPYINGISQILDDPEGGKFWFPYRIVDGEPTLILTSPADVIPKENEHLVMWYRSGSWID